MNFWNYVPVAEWILFFVSGKGGCFNSDADLGLVDLVWSASRKWHHESGKYVESFA